jgi:hypothetical protein
MPAKLGHENVEAQPESANGVGRPLGAAPALAVQEENRASLGRLARRREKRRETRRFAWVALVREDLDEP